MNALHEQSLVIDGLIISNWDRSVFEDMLSIGRGLMAAPQIMLIDEPSLGLSPLFVKETFSVIRRINELGVTVLLVEQNVHQTLALAHYGYVLMQGKVVAEGDTEQLRQNPNVQQAYFG